IWDAQTLSERLSLKGHAASTGVCAISPDGTWMVFALVDGTLKVWDVHTGMERLTLGGSHKEAIRDCAISADGAFIGYAFWELVKIWDSLTGEKLREFKADGFLECCAIIPKSNHIITAGGTGGMRGATTADIIIWDSQSGEKIDTIANRWANRHWEGAVN